MNNLKKIITTFALTLPFFSFALPNGNSANGLLKFLYDIIKDRIIPLLVLLALLYTVFAVVQFIAAGADSQQKEEKKQQIFWGVIGLFVIISVWALVAVIGNTFGIFAGGTLIAQ